MPAESNGAEAFAQTVLSPTTSEEDAADLLIAGYGDDPHAAVVALLKIVRTLKNGSHALRRKPSTGFGRQQSFVLSQAS